MRRRDFITLLSGAAVTWPLAAAAQLSKIPRIGVLMLGNPDPAHFLSTFRGELRKLGYVEGQNIILELRSASGLSENLPSLARELVDLNVDVIVGYQTPCVTAAKQATAKIPIVMSPGADPIGSGFVASFARPGGNITGMAAATVEMTGKNLELIREVLPAVRRVAALGNASDPFHKAFFESIMSAASALDFEIKPILVRGSDELERAFGEMMTSGVGALIVQPSLPRELPAKAALKNRLPLFAASDEFTRAGGLMSYSPQIESFYRGAAAFVDKIIKGGKPADLPVEFPIKFQLLINLKTARALGLTMPPTLLTRADEVIE
jgi:putative tryptophan/tyrosine transport system substrate-binding protein